MDFSNTNLWRKLNKDQELAQSVIDLRENCSRLADTIKTLIPGFTDHSVKHMDALWTVCDAVFTEDEVDKFSVGEAFILGASFYFHDLGMALAATKEGVEKLKQSEKYKGVTQRLKHTKSLSNDQREIVALQIAARELHANNAMSLCNEKIPGLDKFIIEKESIRNGWANFIGDVSASHHWSLLEVETKLGARGVIPAPNKNNIDLGFIACALRIIDYSHINHERASFLERQFRTGIDDDSLLHWKAQENISGPSRFENKLKYASNKPIEDVEAWWLFYDMASGLDKEIVEVNEYLESKPWTKQRLSLEGVQQIKTPKAFAALVRTFNFEPIDIRFKPDSIERLVEILGGKTLYGNDQYAPLRELLQNSRDAILLKTHNELKNKDSTYVGKITISFDTSNVPAKLVVKDNGIGMDSKIIQDYLLGIASDYWNSQDYFNDFPDAREKGFLPTGKFGIGFLSVFMIGDNISVETERIARSNLRLSLRGLGKHGSLTSSMSTGNVGTTVSVEINKQKPDIYSNLEMIVKARAPMLSFPLTINTPTQKSSIEAGWWKDISQKDFFDFTSKWNDLPNQVNDELYFLKRYRIYSRQENLEFDELERFKKWPNKQPEIIEQDYRLLAIPDFGKIILCSKGIAVKTISINGLTGIVNIDNLTLTASRNETLMLDPSNFDKKVTSQIRPKIVEALNDLINEGMLTARFDFIMKVAARYGNEILHESTLPWISIIMPPGNIQLFNFDDTIKLLSNKTEIVLSYGMGPWSTVSACRNNFPAASDSAVIFPVSSAEQPKFGHYSEQDTILLDILPRQLTEKRENIENHQESDDYERALFLTSILKAIAIAWEIDEKKLIYHQWLRRANSFLGVHFIKDELK
jgi:hypothetical protein